MGLLGRLLPRSITAQITGIVAVSILLGLVVSISVAILLSGFNSGRDSPPYVASRIVHVTRIARTAKTPTEPDFVLAAIRDAGIRVDRVAIKDMEVLPEGTGLGFWPRAFAREIRAEPDIEVLDRLRFPSGPDQQLAVRLDADHALVFDATGAENIWRLLLTLPALFLAIVLVTLLLLSVYAVRWIIAPLATVAQAALSFGLSPRDDPIINRGGPREITQVADALNEMRTMIRALLEDRTRMLAAISHDLRTPLTRLRLRIERVSDQPLRDGMMSDLIKVDRMLDETLDYLREDGKSEAMSRFDLPSLLQTICCEFADMGDHVTYDGPARLTWTGRPKALTRAFTNIIQNAVKHSSTVTVTLPSSSQGQMDIEIADAGPGIPAALRDKVFEPFFKADSARSSDKSGFGLGLSIAQDIIERHGGDIRLRGRDPTGLIVHIALPTNLSAESV
jgi:signal transduction histidine kinase